MTDYRKPYHDERLKPCPICGREPWADSKNGTIYCDCGLRYHMNGECHPEWHRMDWTTDEWNRLANVWAENDKLRELVAQLIRCARVGKEDVSHYQPTRDGCGFDCVANGEHCSFAKICDHARAV